MPSRRRDRAVPDLGDAQPSASAGSAESRSCGPRRAGRATRKQVRQTLRKFTPLLFLAPIAFLPAAALAAKAPDRAPTAEERTAIERVLTSNGFVRGDDIELDDGRRWEVDDARNAAGEAYDVKLAPESLRITRRTRDD